MASEPIYITKPLLPPRDALFKGIERIYRSGQVTNAGVLHQELEQRLHEHLGGEAFVLMNNGTTALLAALAVLKLPAGSEVITTPFTFAATVHVITLLGLKPVFADIDRRFMTIDPEDVARKITSRTSCILGVHVYGYPCDVAALGRLASEKRLPLVYDAAHAFGTTLNGKRIAEFGDATAFSFHATKLYNCIEGGGLAVNGPGLGQAGRDFRNFGIRNEEEVASVGINGKLSELHAQVGLLNLALIEEERRQRKIVQDVYFGRLSGRDDISLVSLPEGVSASKQYFPVRIRAHRDRAYEELKQTGIFARKYFYPLAFEYDCYRGTVKPGELPQAERAAAEVLCLPFYGELGASGAERVAAAVLSSLDGARAR